MGRNKLTINFDGFAEMYEKLDRLNADTKKITEEALKESFNYVTPKVEAAIAPHKLTGATQGSLKKNAEVEWSGSRASAEVGFDIKNGGLPSVFLMYGTPKMSPDRKLYNAFYGTATKKKVKEIQEKVFNKALSKYF